MASKSFGSESFSTGGVENAFTTSEKKDGFPTLEWLDVSYGAPTAAGGDIELEGADLLQSQGIDEIVIPGAGDLTIYALKPGNSGITVEVVIGAGALVTAYNTTTKKLTLTLPAIGDSDDDIATDINADAAQCNGYIRATSGGAGDITADMAVAAMTGGTGDYDGNVIKVSGVECLPVNETGATSTAKWTATSVEVTVPNLTGETDARAATDICRVSAMVNGIMANSLTVILA